MARLWKRPVLDRPAPPQQWLAAGGHDVREHDPDIHVDRPSYRVAVKAALARRGTLGDLPADNCIQTSIAAPRVAPGPGYVPAGPAVRAVAGRVQPGDGFGAQRREDPSPTRRRAARRGSPGAPAIDRGWHRNGAFLQRPEGNGFGVLPGSPQALSQASSPAARSPTSLCPPAGEAVKIAQPTGRGLPGAMFHLDPRALRVSPPALSHPVVPSSGNLPTRAAHTSRRPADRRASRLGSWRGRGTDLGAEGLAGRRSSFTALVHEAAGPGR